MKGVTGSPGVIGGTGMKGPTGAAGQRGFGVHQEGKIFLICIQFQFCISSNSEYVRFEAL